jgi:hypothetical protein
VTTLTLPERRELLLNLADKAIDEPPLSPFRPLIFGYARAVASACAPLVDVLFADLIDAKRHGRDVEVVVSRLLGGAR